jgi:DNA-binding CsgD family transcriptional regulator
MTNKQIARELGIVEDTVKKHLQHIYDKIGVRRRRVLAQADQVGAEQI